MKILITGIAGFAGYSIADQLTKENNNLSIFLLISKSKTIGVLKVLIVRNADINWPICTYIYSLWILRCILLHNTISIWKYVELQK